MSVVEAVRAELVADSAVVALVGGRIYPQLMPQGAATPAIVLTVVSSVPVQSFTGAPSELLEQARVQLDVYGRGYLLAHQVADAADAVLGALSRPDLQAYRENQQDLYEDETQLHRVSSDYFVSKGA